MSFWYRFYYILLYPLAMLLYPCRVIGRENIPQGAAIVCANHSNLIDPMFIAIAFGRKRQLFFMAKAELFSIPVLGSLFRSVGGFPVNRGEIDIKSARTALGHLRNGETIMMFPEGTRVSKANSAYAKTGAIRFSLKNRKPIVPIFLTHNKKIFRHVDVVIGKPYIPEASPEKCYEEQSRVLMDKIYSLEPKF